jgi:2-hydroxychromene-2-carboxylate isomerase
MAKIEFFFDIGSPYTYLAFHRLPKLASDADVNIRLRPFLLGGVFKATGNVPPALVPARGQYMLQDLKRWAASIGVPFAFPSCFPINSLVPMRALCTFDDATMRQCAIKVFHAYWAESQDVSQPEVLAALIGADAVARAGDPSIKAILRANTEDAVSRGAFGAPTFFVGNQMFFGNDRLEFVMDAARSM